MSSTRELPRRWDDDPIGAPTLELPVYVPEPLVTPVPDRVPKGAPVPHRVPESTSVTTIPYEITDSLPLHEEPQTSSS